MADRPKPITINQVIGYNVWRLRSGHGWSQKDLADRLTEEGGPTWSHSKVSRTEALRNDVSGPPGSTRQLTPDELVLLARVLRVSLVTLLTPQPGTRVMVGDRPERSDDFFLLTFRLHRDLAEGFDAKTSGAEDIIEGFPQPSSLYGEAYDLFVELFPEGVPVNEERIAEIERERGPHILPLLIEALVAVRDSSRVATEEELAERDRRKKRVERRYQRRKEES